MGAPLLGASRFLPKAAKHFPPPPAAATAKAIEEQSDKITETALGYKSPISHAVDIYMSTNYGPKGRSTPEEEREAKKGQATPPPVTKSRERGTTDRLKELQKELKQKSIGIEGTSAPEAGESGYREGKPTIYKTPDLSAADFLPYPGFGQAESLKGVPAFPAKELETIRYETPISDAPDAGIMSIVKEKGGNWLKPDIDTVLNLDDTQYKLGDSIQPSIDMYKYPIATHALTPSQEAWNTWLDKKVPKYIKNEMGTKHDSVRKKIEETGRTHLDDIEELAAQEDISSIETVRSELGFQREDFSTDPLGSAWEILTDSVIGYGVNTMGQTEVNHPYIRIGEQTPEWQKELADDTPLYTLLGGSYGVERLLDLDHVQDEITNAMATDSGLPQDLQIKPEKLPKMSVADVFDHVAKINEYRIENKKKVPIEQTMAADIVKDYPDEGYRWIELNREGQFAAESEALSHSVRGYEPSSGRGYGQLGGGYSDIEAGRTKIYSLRDTDTGESLATIETTREIPDSLYDPELVLSQAMDLKRMKPVEFPDTHSATEEIKTQWLQNNPDEVITNIHQIKGISNRKPSDTAILYIQDFIKSLPNAELAGGYNPRAGIGDHLNADMVLVGPNVFDPFEYSPNSVVAVSDLIKEIAPEYVRAVGVGQIIDEVGGELVKTGKRFATFDEVIDAIRKVDEESKNF